MGPSEIKRFVLGTAQLGLNYGIANRTGAPTRAEAFQILEFAWEAGIRYFDAAPGYASEPILGEFVRAHTFGKEIKILTKIPSLGQAKDWKDLALRSVERSLRDLKSDSIKALFLHSEDDFQILLDDPAFFQNLMERFPIESLGISVYDPKIVEKTLSVFNGLSYQFPFNLLDRRFENESIPQGKRYARSIFLQGVLASDQIHAGAPGPVKELHHAVWTDCTSLGLSPKEVAWTFVAESSFLDYFLAGVETSDQLRDLLKLKTIDITLVRRLQKLWCEHISPDWLDPRKWSK